MRLSAMIDSLSKADNRSKFRVAGFKIAWRSRSLPFGYLQLFKIFVQDISQ